MRRALRRSVLWAAGGLGALGAGYLTLVASAWARYGHARPARPDEADDLLDRFIPTYDVVERHQIHTAAPAAVTLNAAKNTDMDESLLVRGIIKTREFVLGAEPAGPPQDTGLLARTQAMGWRVLAEVPEREVVVGAVTQPWMPNVVFRGIDAEQFRTFHEPCYVKIVWTLRVDPIGNDDCIFRTETRVATTDDDARRRFRRYWARFSPGIAAIRLAMVQSVKRKAERLAHETVN